LLYWIFCASAERGFGLLSTVQEFERRLLTVLSHSDKSRCGYCRRFSASKGEFFPCNEPFEARMVEKVTTSYSMNPLIMWKF
jgi:hypothetical protein